MCLRHVQCCLYCSEQTLCIGAAGTRKIERSPVIDRGAHDGQTEGDVDPSVEGGVLEHGQALVVIHGQLCMRAGETMLCEQRIGRERSDEIHALALERFDDRRNDFDLFAAEMTIFARVGIETGDKNARIPDTELRDKVGVENAQRRCQRFVCDCF